MKIGFNEATTMKKSNLQTDLVLTEKYGYDYIEIRLDKLKDYLKEHNIEELVDFFNEHKIKPYAFNSIENINFCSKEELENIKKELEWACKISNQINNPYIVVVPTVNKDVKDYNYKDVKEDSIKVLNELASISEEYNVKLAFEPIGFKYCAVNNIKQCWDIVSTLNRDSVGIVIDAFNLYLYNSLKDIEELENVDVNKIFVFHIDDSENLPLEELDHCNRVMPGDGVIPLNNLMRILFKKGFDKIASLELFRPEYWHSEPEEVIKIGREKTEKIIQMYYN
jgi:2-keto-myo-inositol isomerase